MEARALACPGFRLLKRADELFAPGLSYKMFYK